jgi:endonuclease IV
VSERHAPPVHAQTAQLVPLHYSHLGTELRGTDGGSHAPGASADNDHIVIHHGFCKPSFSHKIAGPIYKIKKELREIVAALKSEGNKIWVRPETTGKGSQFGTLDELLKLRDEAKCHLCVDFAHIIARNNGEIDYEEVFSKLKQLKHIHSHFSGINYTAKGERNHELLTKKFFIDRKSTRLNSSHDV